MSDIDKDLTSGYSTDQIEEALSLFIDDLGTMLRRSFRREPLLNMLRDRQDEHRHTIELPVLELYDAFFLMLVRSSMENPPFPKRISRNEGRH